MYDDSLWPRISIVTPSYNQGQFIEDTIQSILIQEYPDLEFIIIDGGSTDNSVEIIKKYENNLTFWVSESDGGQYDAINRGFSKTTGEIMAWLNSDDKYTPWTFSVVGDIFRTHPEVEWVTTLYPLSWDEKGRAVACSYIGGFNHQSFLRGGNLPGRRWYARSWIQQESTFWRRSLWERAGGYIDTNFEFAGDFELWARFFQNAEFYAIASPLAGFRHHKTQKTRDHMEDYLIEAENILHHYKGHPYSKIESMIRKYLHYCISGRQFKRFPQFVGSFLTQSNILYQFKVFIWNGKCWEIITDYVI